MIWTNEAVAEMERLTRLGWSTARVAKEIGFTRSAIIGKAHRIGFALNSQVSMVHAAYAFRPELREISRANLHGVRKPIRISSAPRPPRSNYAREKKPTEPRPGHRKPGRIMFLLGIGGVL